MLFSKDTRVAVYLRKARTYANALIYALASLNVAVAVILLLAAVIAAGTVLETKYGRPYSQWFVYHSGWFLGLLGLLAASVFCAAYVRFPWKRHQTGFVITHAGLLVLLGGSILSYWRGIEGQIVLVEGRPTDQLTLNDRSQITAYWANRPKDRPYVFTFESGPVDWKAGKTVQIGSVDGMSARVLKYFHRSEPIENWVADGDGRSGPLIRFRLQTPPGGHAETTALSQNQPITGFLADQDYGAEALFGPIAIRLQRTTSDAMLADFLHPTDKDLGEKGVLTVYYKESVERVLVDQHLGQAVKIGDTGAKVELVQYLSNAKLDAAGRFQSVGNDVRNPLVELKIELPDDKQPFRQVSYAKSPLLNFDGVYERECPVKFRYQHPKVKPSSAIEFLQARDSKLYCRTITDGKCNSQGEVANSSRFRIQGGFAFTITDYMPHAKREISFKPAECTAGEVQPIESDAAEVEITTAGATKTLWLERNSPEFDSRTIDMPEGLLRTQFSAGQAPLRFSIELVNFKREMNPGAIGNASYSSEVRLIDKERHIDEKQLISMNAPLVHNGFRFYQSSFRDAGHEKEASILSVAYDPGRAPKYIGSLMICVGITTMFYMRAYSFNGCSRQHSGSSQSDETMFVTPAAKISA